MSTSSRVIFHTSLTSVAMALVLATTAPAWAGAGQPGHGHGTDQDQKQTQGHMMGGHGSGHEPAGHHGAMAAIGAPGKAAEVTRTIDVVMQDNFYEPAEITVKPGETVRFRIKNEGTFLHEFGLGTAAMHAAHQKEMTTMFEHGMLEADKINHDRMKMDHGPGRMMMSHDDPNSVLLEPGKSGEVIWKFPDAMKLEFACNIPGHYESGMMGAIRFK